MLLGVSVPLSTDNAVHHPLFSSIKKALENYSINPIYYMAILTMNRRLETQQQAP